MHSNQITAILIDDEKMGRDALKILLRNYIPEVQLLGVADSVATGRRLIAELQPELVFLDVEMPEEDGFSLFRYFPSPTFQVIFVTAFDRYAIRALRLSALDYLLKPVDLEELEQAVARALERCSAAGNPIFQQQSAQLSVRAELDKIAVPDANGFELLPMREIVRLEADSNYTSIFIRGGQRKLVTRALRYFEELLPVREFFRVHASHMVQLKCILKYVKGRGGHLEMEDGSVVPVAARKKAEFLRILRIS
ncbi:MAG: LytTR family DNA-binding domain-containing protein [Bacteroidota bacterium]